MISRLRAWALTPARWRVESRVWTAATALVIGLDVLFPAFWAVISFVYLAIVSNYALVITASGNERAATAALQGNTGTNDDDGRDA